MKINIGLSQKRGLPNYGSAGASCHIELELDAALLSQNPEQFQNRIRTAFGACRQAVHEELSRTPAAGDVAHHSNGRSSRNGQSEQSAAGNAPRPATANQVKAIRAIAHRAGVDLPAELSRRYGVGSPDALNLYQASQLIDALKAEQPVP